MREVEPREGEAWLDVATGTGEIATRAAEAGANVTGLDLAPDLIERAEGRASDMGVEVAFEVGDAENLPYDDASFDTVTSTFGVMFAPDHAAVGPRAGAGHQARRPAGPADLAPDGRRRRVLQGHGHVPATAARGSGEPVHLGRPRPPRRAAGRELRPALRGGRHARSPVRSAEETWELFSTAYGPTKALANSLDDEKREALKSDWIAYFNQFPTDDGGVSQPRPYVLVLGERK